MIERINTVGQTRRLGRRALGRQRLDRRGAGRRGARRASRSRSAPPRSGSRSRPAASTPALVHVASIGLEPAGTSTRSSRRRSLGAGAAQDASRATKYRAGSVLVVGGSPGLTGAPVLAALARLPRRRGLRHRRRAGVGAARDRGARCSRPSSGRCPRTRPAGCCRAPPKRCSRRPSAPTRSCSARASAAATAPATSCASLLEQLRRCRSCSTPTASGGSSRSSASAATVLTPHAGELARPARRPTAAEIDAHRLESVRRAASRFGAIVLLKGADTLVASPREGVLVAAYGAPSLATAGTGDVLAGVIGAFLAKGMEPRLAAAAGAVAHGDRLAATSPAARARRDRPAAGRSGAHSRARAPRRAPLAERGGPGMRGPTSAGRGQTRSGRAPAARRRRPVPARHEDLAPVVLDALRGSARRRARAGDDPVEAVPEPGALREARRLDEARVDRVHRDPARPSSTAIERENASCACFEAEYGPTATRPATETTFTTCEPRAEPGQERPQAPDRAEVVRPISCSISSGERRQELRPPRDPRVVDEQIDPRVPRRAPRRGGLVDHRPVGDVAGLVLVGVRGRAAREPDDMPAVGRGARGRAPRRSPTRPR